MDFYKQLVLTVLNIDWERLEKGEGVIDYGHFRMSEFEKHLREREIKMLAVIFGRLREINGAYGEIADNFERWAKIYK